jgi:hypothetical protein
VAVVNFNIRKLREVLPVGPAVEIIEHHGQGADFFIHVVMIKVPKLGLKS